MIREYNIDKKFQVVIALGMEVYADSPSDARKTAYEQADYYSEGMYEIVGVHAIDITNMLYLYRFVDGNYPAYKYKEYHARNADEAYQMAKEDGMQNIAGGTRLPFKYSLMDRKDDSRTSPKKYEAIVAIRFTENTWEPYRARRNGIGQACMYLGGMFEIIGASAVNISNLLIPFDATDKKRSVTFYAHDWQEAHNMATADGFEFPFSLDTPDFQRMWQDGKMHLDY